MENQFPNGLEDYLETHFEISNAIQSQLDNEESIAFKIAEQGGTGQIYVLAKELTDEFTQKYSDEYWEANDFFDTLDEFLHDRI
jgi:hypothetical protein